MKPFPPSRIITLMFILALVGLSLLSSSPEALGETMPSDETSGQGEPVIQTKQATIEHTKFGSLAQANVDSYEPDDNITLAKQIDINTTQTHSIYPIGDVDWVFFEINETLRIQIETNGSHGFDTAIKLFDSAGNLLEYNDDGGDYLYSQINTTLKSGRYYVYVEGFRNSSEIPSYDILVRSWLLSAQLPNSGKDPYEPDNDYSLAVSISVGETITRAIEPANDTDWFMFEVHNYSYAEILTFAPQMVDTFLRLYDANLNIIGENDDQNFLFAGIVQYLFPGTYYFAVTSYAQSYQIDEYQVRLRLIEDGPDKYEDDNSMDNATEIVNGEGQLHTIHSIQDEDYLKFVLEKPSFLYIRLDSYSRRAWYSLLVKESNETLVLDPPFEPTLFDPGTYYLRIYSTSNFATFDYYDIIVFWEQVKLYEFNRTNNQLLINGTTGINRIPFAALLANFSESSSLTATLAGGISDGSNTYLRLRGEDGAVFYNWFGPGYDTATFAVSSNQIYEIVFFTTALYTIPYELNLTAEFFESDVYEPDDSPNNATAITSEQGSQKHSLIPDDDVDWFAFQISSEKALMEVNIKIDQYPSPMVVARFFNEDMSVIAEEKSSEYIFINPSILEKGTYYLAVQNAANGVVEEYTLSWKITTRFINVTSPRIPGTKFEIGSEIEIKWESFGVEKFTINLIEATYFTTTLVIINGYSGDSYVWRIPNIDTGAYMIVVLDASDPTIKGDSTIFQIVETSFSGDKGGGGRGFFRISFAFDSVLVGLVSIAGLVPILIRKKSAMSEAG